MAMDSEGYTPAINRSVSTICGVLITEQAYKSQRYQGSIRIKDRTGLKRTHDGGDHAGRKVRDNIEFLRQIIAERLFDLFMNIFP